jgi:hypothetical protein
MTREAEFFQLSTDRCLALILDNEVTVGEFVANPPVPWSRLVRRDGRFQVDESYPTPLTMEQAKFEMRNWDQVSLPAIKRMLAELDDSVGYVIVGNNAGQGLPLAQSLPRKLIAERAAIIYANTLSERTEYENAGFRTFFRRRDAVARLLEMSKNAGRPLALCFINTIQHNEFNYHAP